MAEALELAHQAASYNEVPVGAVVIENGNIIGRGFNQPIRTNDPTAHAEIVALRDAAQHKNNYRLPNSTLYVTIEPCTMCLGALIHARTGLLVFGAAEPRAGAVLSRPIMLDSEHYNHQIVYLDGVRDSECGDVLKEFFKRRRLAK
ncbi:MAG: tRNA-specific adenosine deaminase [SAR86 cluster bacterium]|uniref:tRNA-specific adenosine deaminase n=1 Tax=SAR86 cluster bacterium TaxID=2030880 RepID=A0A2A5B702_9GAMM|nr:MAG: tRNA-specific adenosine deaminase [SAR86 cluster bacterium]